MIDPDFPWLGENDRIRFPDPARANREGILASGANLSPGVLLSAYEQGVFPWYSGDSDPILWWSPHPRFVLFPDKLRVNDTLRKSLRKCGYRFTLDSAFPEVIRACKTADRPDGPGTWITDEMEEAYIGLHRLGYAHSVETWMEHGTSRRLVGGLYGVSLGGVFFGESMFSHASDASKAALVHLVRLLGREGFSLIDSQVRTPHIEKLGAEEIPRPRYLELLAPALTAPTRRGNWGVFWPDFARND